MATYTPILHIQQVATNQNQKEATINTGLAILEAAANDTLVIDMSAGSVTLSQDQFTKYMMFRCQGHTTSVNLNTFLSKRVFIVANESTEDVVVCPGTASTGTITVGPSKIVLMQSNGVDTIRALSSGVGLLTDLSDIDVLTVAPTEGDVLRYNATSTKWEAGSFSASVFVGLTDTPSTYTAAAHQFVRVNGAEDGLEFYQPTKIVSDTFFGVPDASQIIFHYVVAETFTLPANIASSQFKFAVAPTAETTLVILKQGVSVGTITFQSDGTFAVDFPSDVLCAPGDSLQIIASATPDDTAGTFAASFVAVPMYA